MCGTSALDKLTGNMPDTNETPREVENLDIVGHNYGCCGSKLVIKRILKSRLMLIM